MGNSVGDRFRYSEKGACVGYNMVECETFNKECTYPFDLILESISLFAESQVWDGEGAWKCVQADAVNIRLRMSRF